MFLSSQLWIWVMMHVCVTYHLSFAAKLAFDASLGHFNLIFFIYAAVLKAVDLYLWITYVVCSWLEVTRSVKKRNKQSKIA